MAYTYSKVTAANGVVLHSIKTSPNNVYPKKISNDENNVIGQSSTGLNGGYFILETNTILQIAVNNNLPVGGARGSAYGIGETNYGDVARGTLVWDSREQQFSIQVVKSMDELNVVSRNQYWAQGGISMTFQNPGVWKKRAENENMQGIDSNTQRSGVVYNNTNNIWLIMTPTQCTAEQFRTAILGSIGSGTLVNGIFLDGGGSSQMRAGTTTIAASSRKVPEMLALRS